MSTHERQLINGHRQRHHKSCHDGHPNDSSAPKQPDPQADSGLTRRMTDWERRDDDADRIFALLEQAGHRLTEPRVELVRAVSAQAERPFTGEDLYEELRATGLGRATVFRTLKLLLDLNILSRLHMEDGCQQYILAPIDDSQGDNHHDRLICRLCGRVAYLEHCPMEDALAGIAKRSGYSVETHHLDIIGLCGDCHAPK